MYHHLDCSDSSSMIDEVFYNPDTQDLQIIFKSYWAKEIIYKDFPLKCFIYFSEAESFGKFYNNHIKDVFHHYKPIIMPKEKASAPAAEQPKEKKRPETINKAGNWKRFIKMSINLTKIEKDWLYEGENGSYANITLMLLPDGTVDKYGNLGMIVQDVPKEVYEREKNQTVKSQGEILGNGAELKPFVPQVQEGTPGVQTKAAGLSKDALDDLPF